MPDNSEIEELPQGWEAKEYELTGHFKLYAVFQHEDSEKEVHIVPYKTYGLPGFTNSHRVTIETPENGLEVVAEGLEVEHADEAEEVAIDAMKRVETKIEAEREDS
jgi:hypothetical protein